MDYILTVDYHTHTVHSHGLGTIRDNVLAARKRGLKEIGITDHGPNLEHGISREQVPKIRQMVDGINEEFDDITGHLGVEANIINIGNGLDIAPEEFVNYDYVIAGYHYGLANGYCAENWKDMYKGFNSKSLMIKNTEMMLNAIYSNDLKILTHPGDKARVDILELAKACAETDTLMEINMEHDKLNTVQLGICAKTDAKFVISSDAHVPERVGSYEGGLLRAVNAGIDLERIVNIRRK
ncbi:MAG: PHP domain-containing protein [Eubacterium sp.]|nr:PHP domain-containing protein [Candidatus Colimonas fimequi]